MVLPTCLADVAQWQSNPFVRERLEVQLLSSAHMNKTRLTKRLERQVLKNLFFSLIGIIIIVTVLIKFGIPLMINFSLFLSGGKTYQDSKVDNRSSFIPSPILNTQYEATNSAQVQIEGTAVPNHTIVLYVNGSLTDKISTDNNGYFSSVVTLAPNKNIIKAKAITSNGKESVLSESLIVAFKSVSPTLEISSPSDNQSFSKDQNTIEIKGKTDREVRVTVNGYWAIIDENNNFSYNLTLKDGENEIKIIATDQAGNKTEKTLKVTYSP